MYVRLAALFVVNRAQNYSVTTGDLMEIFMMTTAQPVSPFSA